MPVWHTPPHFSLWGCNKGDHLLWYFAQMHLLMTHYLFHSYHNKKRSLWLAQKRRREEKTWRNTCALRYMLGLLLIHLQNKLASCLISDGLEWELLGERVSSATSIFPSSQSKKEPNWDVISSFCEFVPTEAFLDSLKEFLCHFEEILCNWEEFFWMLFFHLNFMFSAAVIFSLEKKAH